MFFKCPRKHVPISATKFCPHHSSPVKEHKKHKDATSDPPQTMNGTCFCSKETQAMLSEHHIIATIFYHDCHEYEPRTHPSLSTFITEKKLCT